MESRYEIQFEDLKLRSLYAIDHFHQGETILGLPQIGQSMPDMYSIEVSPGVHIDCAYSPAGAINHSCNPNAAVRGFKIIAWRCIRPGDEITIDYLRTESKLASPFNCSCGFCPAGTRIE